MKPVFEDAAVDGAKVDTPDGMPDALMCTSPQMKCGDMCFDVTTDETHCGDCDTACDPGQTCDMGVCCDAGQVNCGGTCVDLDVDNDHCGTCTEICDQGMGETCMNGTCCGGNNTACPGGQCFDLENNDMHCGDCTTSCSGSTPDCSNGHCCATGQTWCGDDLTGSCVDLNTDEANCGACAGDPNAEVCGGATDTCCGGNCVDVDSDEANCGNCAGAVGGDVCSASNPSETCDNGLCCATGTINCGGTCIDPNTDEANCGGCSPANGGSGDVCAVPGEQCLAGGGVALCCGPGQINCNGVCVDPDNDNANCGGCAGATGTACMGGTPNCSGGECQSGCGPGEINCSGDCIDPTSDHDHCGGCIGSGGTACGPNEVCSDADGTAGCETMCDASEAQCDGDCVDTLTDPNNCGSCGNICDGPTAQNPLGEECVNGSCQMDCPGSQVLCSGVCRDLQSDEMACGSCTAQPCNGQCLGGLCCPNGTIRCGNSCVNPTMDPMNCGGCSGTPSGDVCDTSGGNPEQCKPDGQGGGECCHANENVCGGACSNPLTDGNNCGGCFNNGAGPGDDCVGTETCDNGLCCASGFENVNGKCCQTGFLNCNVNGTPTCVNPQSDDENCGQCGMDCTMSGQICVGGGCTSVCNAPFEIDCFGLCLDIDTNNDFCGPTCADCPTGGSTCVDSHPGAEHGVGAACSNCPQFATGDGPALGCHGQCTNTKTDNTNCGACSSSLCVGGQRDGLACNPLLGSSGNPDCPNGTCPADTTHVCDPGEVCTDGVCCTAGLINCGGQCVDPETDPNNCGGCATQGGEDCSGNQTCNGGFCSCPFNTEVCNGSCINVIVDPKNCGGCGASTCTGGTKNGQACDATKNTNAAGANPDCPGAGAVCTAVNQCTPSAPYCVSNGCTATCPAPLIGCGTGANAKCINPDSDDVHCGACQGTAGAETCGSTQGCVDGNCVTDLLPPTAGDPTLKAELLARCQNGGPPIIVPNDDGDQVICTGNLAATSFTFGMCARAKFDVPAQIFTDAFNSNFGPYRPVVTVADCGPGGSAGQCACTSNAQCTGGAACLGAGTALDPKVCIGGGVGTNGTINPILKTQQDMHVGGSLWAFGTIGMDFGKTIIVKQDMYNEGPFHYSGGGNKVYGNVFTGGAWSATGGQATFTIGNTNPATGGDLTTATACPPPGATGLTLLNGGTCTSQSWATTTEIPNSGMPPKHLAPPCGDDADLTRDGGWDVPVKTIVEYFRNPAHNDNKAIGLKYDAINTATGDIRLDLPCGYYYLDSLQGSNKVTIVVTGRVGLFIGGAADINVEMTFDVRETGSLDMFVGGVVNIAHSITLGSPAYPRLTRMYIGSPSVGAGNGVTGDPCNEVSDCAGGKCSVCPAVSGTFTGYAPCTLKPTDPPTGKCDGLGTGRTPSINMSQGGFFNGLLWAGYGGFSTSNAVEMYGSIFADTIGASGNLKIHYDNGAVNAVDECPPPPGGTQSCESCRDCGNQPCGPTGICLSTCTADTQCCPPLHCDVGNTNRCVL